MAGTEAMMLAAFSGPGRFWRGNLHGHSTASDGAISPAEACARYRAAGYDFVALTDHFLADFGFPVTDTRPFRGDGFATLLGAELHAPATSLGELWHIVAVGLPPDFPGLRPGETGPAIARRAAEAGAFVALAHPHWLALTLEDGLSIDTADAVEVYNHKSALEVDRGDGLVLLDALLHAGRRVGAIASDDSHWNGTEAFGGWVMVRAEENAPDALLAALKRGAYYASQGPTIDSVTRDGDALEIACSPAASIILAGPGTWRQRALGTGLTRARLPLEPEPGAWRRLIVRDAVGRRAWSNPLWLDG
jgi:hypothetical protein